MRTRPFIKKKTVPENMDKPFMFESLIFVLIMLGCVFVFIYGIVEIVIFLEQNASLSQSP